MTEATNDKPSRDLLSNDAIREWAAAHHPWSVGTGSDRLERTFEFEDFNGAMMFMARVAHVADTLDHHPNWENVYNKVWVQLSTHDANGVTEFDLRLAEAMNDAAKAVGTK